MTTQVNGQNENEGYISRQENQSSTPSSATAALYRAVILAGAGSFLTFMLEEDELHEMKRVELDESLIRNFKTSFKGIFVGGMDPVALSAGTEAILQTLEAKKQSNEEKKQEDLTHHVNLAPETIDRPHSGETEMLLEVLFGHSGNPVALANGLEAVLQNLAVKVFSQDKAEEKVFNDDELLALSNLSEKAKRFLKHPEMSYPLLSFAYTRREFLEEIKELKKYIHELNAFIQAQPNADESHKNQHYSSFKGISSPK
jgi:hypothetical protein